MKISENTIEILKNFSTINNGIVINKGNVVKTCTAAKNVLAEAEIEETFDMSFGIYDLNEFLGVVSLFPELPNLELNDEYVLIGDKLENIKYFYTPAEMIVFEEKTAKLPNVDFEIDVAKESMDSLFKGMNILKAPNVALESDGKSIYFSTYNPQNKTSNVYKKILGKAKTSKKFKLVCAIDHMKMIPLDYKISASFEGLVQFKSTERKYTYSIMLDEKSEM